MEKGAVEELFGARRRTRTGSMVSPEQQAMLLHAAILACEHDRVVTYLSDGCDPNTTPSLPPLADLLQTDTDGTKKLDKTATICSSRLQYSLTPLHVAVITAAASEWAEYKSPSGRSYYTNSKTGHTVWERPTIAVDPIKKILQLLLDHGAELQAKASQIVACNISGFTWKKVSGTALEVALTLKQCTHSSSPSSGQWCSAHILGELVDLLYRFSNPAPKPAALPMTAVPMVTRSTWSHLLLSDMCSDVTFVCGDHELPAHTCVLASASAYFRQLFTGPWNTQVVNGKLATAEPPEVMRAVLSFMYTGEVDSAVVNDQAEALFSVAQQYFLAELATLAEARLLESIEVSTLKQLLVLAHLHDATTLKEQCFDFVRQNKATALTEPSMLSLAGEEPTLWAEVVAMASANEPATKRARTGPAVET